MHTQKIHSFGAKSASDCLGSGKISSAFGLFMLSAALFGPSLASADTPPALPQLPVTPIDREQDLQNKIRLQEKIGRELKENRRRILEKSQEDSEKYQPATPSLPREQPKSVPHSD